MNNSDSSYSDQSNTIMDLDNKLYEGDSPLESRNLVNMDLDKKLPAKESPKSGNDANEMDVDVEVMPEENPNSDNDANKMNINKQQMAKESPKSGNDGKEINIDNQASNHSSRSTDSDDKTETDQDDDDVQNNSPEEEDKSTAICGCCNKPFQLSTKKSLHIKRKCVICKEIYPINQLCAGKMHKYIVQQNNFHQGPTDDVIKFNADQFDRIPQLRFHCKNCHQDKCFSCGTNHRAGYIKPVECSKCKLKWSYSLYDQKNKQGCLTKARQSDNSHQPLCYNCNSQNLRRSGRNKDNSPSSKQATLSADQNENTPTSEKNVKKKQYGSTEAFLADVKWM